MKRFLMMILASSMLLTPCGMAASGSPLGPYTLDNEIRAYEIMGLDVLKSLRTNLFYGMPPEDCQCCPSTYQGQNLTDCIGYFSGRTICLYNFTDYGVECYE